MPEHFHRLDGCSHVVSFAVFRGPTPVGPLSACQLGQPLFDEWMSLGYAYLGQATQRPADLRRHPLGKRPAHQDLQALLYDIGVLRTGHGEDAGGNPGGVKETVEPARFIPMVQEETQGLLESRVILIACHGQPERCIRRQVQSGLEIAGSGPGGWVVAGNGGGLIPAAVVSLNSQEVPGGPIGHGRLQQFQVAHPPQGDDGAGNGAEVAFHHVEGEAAVLVLEVSDGLDNVRLGLYTVEDPPGPGLFQAGAVLLDEGFGLCEIHVASPSSTALREITCTNTMFLLTPTTSEPVPARFDDHKGFHQSECRHECLQLGVPGNSPELSLQRRDLP